MRVVIAILVGLVFVVAVRILFAVPVAATSTPATTALLARTVIVFVLVRGVDELFFVVVLVIDDSVELRRVLRLGAVARHRHLRAFVFAFRHDFGDDAVTLFDLDQVVALFVKEVDGSLGAGSKADARTLTLGSFLFDQAQRRKTGRACGADEAGTVAVRAFARGRFENAGAQALAAHFHEAEA